MQEQKDRLPVIVALEPDELFDPTNPYRLFSVNRLLGRHGRENAKEYNSGNYCSHVNLFESAYAREVQYLQHCYHQRNYRHQADDQKSNSFAM